MDNSKSTIKYSPFTIALTVFVNGCLFFFLFLWLAQSRNIDGDEGLYLEAARLVSQGKKLYIDFFYQQMPLLPYLYAFWMKAFGFTLFSARSLSATLTALTGLVVLIYAAQKTRSLLLLNLVALLFYGSGMILAWAPVVKTHPLNMFTLAASCLWLLEWRRKQKAWRIVLAALAIGLGVNARLTLGPILFFYFIFISLTSTRHRLRDSVLFLFVVALTSILTFYYFFYDSQLFIKFNLTYHTSVYPGVVDRARRLYTAGNLFQETQVFMLCVAAQIGILMGVKKDWKAFLKSDEGFITLLLILFISIHMASAEPYTQYFVTMIPLLLMLILPLLSKIQSFPKVLSFSLLGIVTLFYLTQARASMDFEIASMLSDRTEWSIWSIQNTVRKIKRVMKPGESCLTWWPGFAFMAGCRSVPGMENHMRNYAVQRLLEKDVEGYKMMSDEELLKDIQSEKYRVVVDSLYHIDSPYYYDIQEALREHYWDLGDGVKVISPAWFKATFRTHQTLQQGNEKNYKGEDPSGWSKSPTAPVGSL